MRAWLKKNENSWGLGGALLLPLIIYLPTLSFHFVGADFIALERVATSGSVREVFSWVWPGTMGGYFRPLQWIPFLLGNAFAGLPIPPDPRWLTNFSAAYHFLNILFHLGSTGLVYALALFLTGSAIWGMLAALIFAVHPANTEVICWVAAIGDYALVFFILLSVLLFGKFFLSCGKKTASGYFAGSVLSFALALCAKEAAAITPLLIILTALFLRGRSQEKEVAPRSRVYSPAPFFLLLLAYAAVRSRYIPQAGFPLKDYLAFLPSVPVKAVYYARDLVSPLDLVALKQFLYNHSLLQGFLAGALAASIILLALLIRRIRRQRLLLFSLFWVGLTLIIPLFTPLSPMRRHLYLPLFGYAIFITVFLRSLRRKYIAVAGLAIIIALQALTTLERNSWFKFTSRVVQYGLHDLKRELPRIEEPALVFLVGIPGVANNTPAFWDDPVEAMRFLYQKRDLKVYCLSFITFTKERIQNTDLTFKEPLTFEHALDTNLDEYIRLGGNPLSGAGTLNSPESPARSHILGQDKFGNINKVEFRLDERGIAGQKVYLIGMKEGRLGVLWAREF